MKTSSFETCKKTGVMFYGRKSRRAQDIKNKFWKWCMAQRQPFVFVYASDGKMNVTFEMPTANGIIDQTAKKNLLLDLIPLGFQVRPIEDMGGSILDVPPEQINDVVSVVLNVSRDFCSRNQIK